ncbi:hypothetical protein K435DRAFT_852213 [Dendrothele bispora CBS 962.96]|uniref:Uncharacterized protein n=1 Tax=Dendrothele bispora (strain CBS 962.96) TaxID=1314807 RepID=A0A4V4HHL0_DENBC|nr:hypothetical protein K435DRAFT_852213 [Dendrothele bispora CBS 962.96]
MPTSTSSATTSLKLFGAPMIESSVEAHGFKNQIYQSSAVSMSTPCYSQRESLYNIPIGASSHSLPLGEYTRGVLSCMDYPIPYLCMYTYGSVFSNLNVTVRIHFREKVSYINQPLQLTSTIDILY